MKIPVAVLGAGNMGEAIIAAIHKSYKVYVCEQDEQRAAHIANQYDVTCDDLDTAVKKSEIVIIAVKPQGFESVLTDMRDVVTDGHLVVSIAAGITTGYIEKLLGDNIKVIRTMPNLPAKTAHGMTALSAGRNITPDDLHKASVMLKFIGETLVVDETMMDAVTAVSGSGPAYVFLFVEMFMKAAIALNLTETEASTLVRQTMRGSLQLLDSTKNSAAELREKVTSKGGTTAAALDVFKAADFEKTFKDALKAAQKRSGELAK